MNINEYFKNLKERLSLNLFRINRCIRFFLQRKIRGWDDSDTWSMNITLSKLIVPRLKRFKELKSGVPCFEHIDPNGNYAEAEKYWDECIDKMILAFELIADDDSTAWYSAESTEKINEGLDLFRKYFSNLWW